MKQTMTRRVGATALATATVISGLAFGPGAVAFEPTVRISGGVPVVIAEGEATDRLTGPLVMQVNASGDKAYTTMHTNDRTDRLVSYDRFHSTYDEAVAAAETWSMPALGTSGPVTGTGEQAATCLSFESGEAKQRACDGGSAQDWVWVSLPTALGSDRWGLAPAADPATSLRPRNINLTGTWMQLVALAQARPFVLSGDLRTTTTLGIHELSAAPSSGDDFARGDAGTVSWNAQVSEGAPLGMNVRQGEALSWAFTLPAGLTSTAHTDEGSDWTHERAVSDPDESGRRTVTVTVTRTAPAVAENHYADLGSPLSFPVTAEDGLATGASITGSFAPLVSYRSDATEASVAVPVAAVDHGTITPVEVESTTLIRGADTAVSFVVENTEDRSALLPTVTLTAPEGTTFAPTTTVEAQWRWNDSDEWRHGGNLRMTDVTISDDGTTLTGTKDSGTVGSPQQFRYTVLVSTPEDAVYVDENALGFVYRGTSSAGDFRASGRSPVSIDDFYVDATLDSHADGDTFTPGVVTFQGTGTPGAEVTVTPGAASSVSGVVAEDGTWELQRYMGNGFAALTVTHTASTGRNTIGNIRLYSDQASQGPFEVTSPIDGDSHLQQGWVTFTGTGTTWSTVSISDGSSVAPTTATVQYDGSWTARRWVGTEKTTFTVTSARADVQNGAQSIEFNTGVSGREFTLDSHTDGGTFTPGNITFTGEGSTGDRVAFTAPGLAPLEATVNAAGEWSIPRWLGNGQITFTVTHTPVVGEQTQQTLRLYSDQVPVGDLVVTSPVDGDGHAQQGWVTFTGTGTTWSTVSVDDGTAAAPSTATVQYDGSWSMRRWVGTDPVTFTVTSARADVENGTQQIRFNTSR